MSSPHHGNPAAALADRTIDALTDEHHVLAGVVRGLLDDELSERSAAAGWTVAQVLSHLGSGAEITLATLRAAQAGKQAPGNDFNTSVWDRWNAMGAAEQRAGFLDHDAALVDALTALDAQQRQALRVPVGFAPAPLSVAAFAGLRLNETAAHGWDVRAALEPGAALADASAQVLAELFTAEIAFLLGFVAKPGAVPEPVRLEVVDAGYGLAITDPVRLTRGVDAPTATFDGALEALVRLLTGRLGPEHAPADLRVHGNVTLDQLRAVFPGY